MKEGSRVNTALQKKAGSLLSGPNRISSEKIPGEGAEICSRLMVLRSATLLPPSLPAELLRLSSGECLTACTLEGLYLLAGLPETESVSCRNHLR